MPSWQQEITDNIRSLQEQVNRIVTARPGPTSYGPNDGHVRLHDGTHDTGYLDFNGLQLRYRGGLRGLTELTESFATSIESHTVLLGEHEGRLDGHDGDVSRIDGTLGEHNTRINTNDAASRARDTALSGRVSTAQSRADAAHANAGTAHARADAAYSRAGTGISNAATAQRRADAAYSRAGTAEAEAAAANARAAKVINCINGVIPAGANLSSGGFSTMAAASEWQQLKNCINS